MTVLGLCGFAQSGKDSAASFLVERGWKRLAFADALRDSVYLLNPIVHVSTIGNASSEYERVQDLVDRVGWDVAKVSYPEIRQLLQRMGTEVGRALYGESFWVDRVLTQMERSSTSYGEDVVVGNYVITDVRFPNEVEAVRSVGGKVIRIYREGVGAVNTHVSDTGVDDLEIDAVVLNQGSLDEFRAEVLKVVGL